MGYMFMNVARGKILQHDCRGILINDYLKECLFKISRRALRFPHWSSRAQGSYFPLLSFWEQSLIHPE